MEENYEIYYFFRYIKSLSENILKNQTFLVGRSKERVGVICKKNRRRMWIKIRHIKQQNLSHFSRGSEER